MIVLREAVFLLLVILVMYEAIEYYAVNSARLTLVEPVGAVEGSRIIARVYYENPAPLPVYVLNLTLNVECDGTMMNSQIADFSLPAGSSGGLLVSMRAEQPPRGTCTARASAELATSLLRIVRMPVARKSVTSSFELPRFGGVLLWAGWNTTWIEAGKCAEVIVLASPGVSYTAYVLEDSPGKPPEKKMEFSGQGNTTKVFCAPVGANPLVVRGYFVALESRELGVAWTQSSSYPPRLKLRG
uniref:Uncharacterized protein n=1 Tax=Thermofilum pendens TaxID=2269 RepID=A0A7C4B8U5_THEPE